MAKEKKHAVKFQLQKCDSQELSDKAFDSKNSMLEFSFTQKPMQENLTVRSQTSENLSLKKLA